MYAIARQMKNMPEKKAPLDNISLFIHHVFSNYSADKVAAVFEKLRIGKVDRVDLISKVGKDKKKYYSAYVHFDHWTNNAAARNFQERLFNPNKEARLVYDDPWYWIVLPYKSNLNNNFNGYKACVFNAQPAISHEDEMEQQLDAIEAIMEQEDQYLVHIDSRYVQALETELQQARAIIQWDQSHLQQTQLQQSEQQYFYHVIEEE